MGKTPKSKNVYNRGNSHLQPKVLLHRPKNIGMGRMTFPGISEQSVPPKRRMKLSGTLSRKSSHGQGVIIKVFSSSITEQNTDKSRIPRMSVVAAESSESIITIHQPDIVLENGKEDSQETEDPKSFKEKPIANGSELEATIFSKTEMSEIINDKLSNQVKESNSIQEPAGDAESSSVKLPKVDGESKKQRSGTPQSRSSTPQRKSGRVRSKHDSPSKSTTPSTLTPGLKVLKINMTPSKNVTNGTMEGRSKDEYDITKGKSAKTANAEQPNSFDTNATTENDGGDVGGIVQSENVISEEESSKPQATDVNAPYLRSLRMVAGRRSLSSNSPSKSLPVSSPSGSNTASGSQWRKRQSRRKESAHIINDSELQGSESEFNSSVSSGKRKAERADDMGIEVPVGTVKKPKNEDEEIKLFLSDESEENNQVENESEEYFNSSQYSKSSDELMAELKDLNESDRSDDHFVKNESMEYAYEAREIENTEKLHETPTAANQSSNKRWCILM